jgi:hypothetical protein
MVMAEPPSRSIPRSPRAYQAAGTAREARVSTSCKYLNKKSSFVCNYRADFGAKVRFSQFDQSLVRKQSCGKNRSGAVADLWITGPAGIRCLFGTGCTQVSGEFSRRKILPFDPFKNGAWRSRPGGSKPDKNT